MGGARQTIGVLAALLCLLGSGLSRGAAAPTVCLVADPAATAAFEGAWTVARRKARVAATLVSVPAAAACPPGVAATVEVVLGAAVRVTAADGAGVARDLAGLEPWQQARAAVRWTLELLADDGGAAVPFVVPPAPPAVAPVRGPRWGALVAGHYELHPAPGRHRWGVAAEGQAAFWDERLVVGLRLAWLPPQGLADAAADARWTALSVGPQVRLGVNLAPLWLRAGVDLAAERRRLEVAPAARLDTVAESHWAMAVVVEGEAEWQVAARWRLSATAGLRAFATGHDYAWRAAVVARAPRVTFAAALGVGWWFN